MVGVHDQEQEHFASEWRGYFPEAIYNLLKSVINILAVFSLQTNNQICDLLDIYLS